MSWLAIAGWAFGIAVVAALGIAFAVRDVITMDDMDGY